MSTSGVAPQHSLPAASAAQQSALSFITEFATLTVLRTWQLQPSRSTLNLQARVPRRIHAVSAPRCELLGASGRASALDATLTAMQNNASVLQGVISEPADAEPTSAPQVSCKLSPLLAVAAIVKMAMHHASLNTNCEHMCVLIFCKPGVHMQANHPGSRIPWCAAKVSMPLLCAASAEQFKTRRTSSHSCYEHAVRSFLCADRGALMNGKHNECRLQTLRHQVCADGKL